MIAGGAGILGHRAIVNLKDKEKQVPLLSLTGAGLGQMVKRGKQNGAVSLPAVWSKEVKCSA